MIKYGNEYLLYYCKTYSRTDHRNTVAFRRSRDLIHWSEPEFALVLSEYPRLINSGHTESPYVFEYGGKFYLAVCSPFYHYRLTRVFISDTPFRFDERNEITSFIAHCAEILNFDDRWFLSHGGWFYDGVYLAPINWKVAKKFEPQFIFINSGEKNDYLLGTENARVMDAELTGRFSGNKVVRIGKGGKAIYLIDVPGDLNTVQLFLCGKGKYQLVVNGKANELNKDLASSEGLDLYWLDEKYLGSDSKLKLEIKAPDGTYDLNFIRIYFVN